MMYGSFIANHGYLKGNFQLVNDGFFMSKTLTANSNHFGHISTLDLRPQKRLLFPCTLWKRVCCTVDHFETRIRSSAFQVHDA